MKSIFDIVLIIYLSLIFMFCMVIFSGEIFIRQQSIHIRNKVDEIIEINSGYTTTAESEVNQLISNLKYDVKIEVSKKGKLNYGEKITYKVIMNYERKLPFTSQPQNVEYIVNGIFYNANY